MKRLTARIPIGSLVGMAVCPELFIHGTGMEIYDDDTIELMIKKTCRL